MAAGGLAFAPGDGVMAAPPRIAVPIARVIAGPSRCSKRCIAALSSRPAASTATCAAISLLTVDRSVTEDDHGSVRTRSSNIECVLVPGSHADLGRISRRLRFQSYSRWSRDDLAVLLAQERAELIVRDGSSAPCAQARDAHIQLRARRCLRGRRIRFVLRLAE